MTNVSTIDQIKKNNIKRISTGFLNLDFMLGESKNDLLLPEVGIAEGSLLILAGSAGCGKSRLSLNIATNINRMGYKILVFEAEAPLHQLKDWISGNIENPKEFFVSDEIDYKNQIALIEKYNPDFVVIDSVNMYDVHHSKIKQLISDLQNCAKKNNTAIWMIGQLDTNSNNPKIRGSQDWVYLPDVVLFMKRNIENKDKIVKNLISDARLEAERIGKKLAPMPIVKHELGKYADSIINSKKHEVKVYIPQKNRYGKSGEKSLFKHIDNGLIEINENGNPIFG